MVQLVGTYKLESQENYKEYLVSLGVDDEKATSLADLREDAVISAVDGDSVTVVYGGVTVKKYPLNKELEHASQTGQKIWTTTTLANGILTLKTKLNAEGTLLDERVLKFTDAGVTITLTNSKGAKSVRKYKRA